MTSRRSAGLGPGAGAASAGPGRGAPVGVARRLGSAGILAIWVMSLPRAGRRRAASGPPSHASELPEETQKDRTRLVGDRQRLDAKLLLGLQGGQLSAFLAEVGVDQVTDPGVQGVLQVLNEGQLVLQGRGPGAELAQ